MRLTLAACLVTLLVAVSCEFKTEIKTPSTAPAGGTTASSSKIKNGIELKSNGLTVSQAFLLYEDGGLVPEANTTGVNQKVILRLIIDKGWTEENGKVFPGASEKIETNDGAIVLNEADLFASMAEGVNAKDAQYITLSAVITKLDKLYDYFVVHFKVWDKKSTASVEGSYKLYIK
jgi:hypothetical protein